MMDIKKILMAFVILVSPTFAVWDNASCNYALNLTFNNAWSNQAYTNFTALVVLNNSVINMSKTNYDDLQFYKSGVKLSYDVDTWNITSNSLIWLKVPSIATTSTDYAVLYYNCSANASNDLYDVWFAYKGVYHLNYSGVYSDDSSPEWNDLIKTGTIALNYSSTVPPFYALVSLGNPPNDDQGFYTTASAITYPTNSPITISAWAYPTTDSGSGDAIVGFGTVYGTATTFEIELDIDTYVLRVSGAGDMDTGVVWSPDNNIYQLYTATYDGSVMYLYRNGTLIGSNSTTLDLGTKKFGVGRIVDYGAGYWNGRVDEARISLDYRSNKLINATYLAGINQFITYGSVASLPVVANTSYLIITSPTLDIPVWNESNTVNFTALGVSSGAFYNMSLLINGTEWKNISEVVNDTNQDWSINLANGWYQYFFKAYAVDVFNSSETGSIWVNYTEPEVPGEPEIPFNYSGISHSICLDNDTLFTELAYTLDGATHNRSEVIYCENGCYLNACKKTVFEGYLTDLGLFIGVMVALLLIFMVSKKGRHIKF